MLNILSRILSGGSRVMFGGTRCSNRHEFYRRQAELGNRLRTYVASLQNRDEKLDMEKHPFVLVTN